MDYRCGASQAAHKESEPQTRVQWRSRSAPTALRQQRDEFGDTRIGRTNQILWRQDSLSPQRGIDEEIERVSAGFTCELDRHVEDAQQSDHVSGCIHDPLLGIARLRDQAVRLGESPWKHAPK